MKKIIFVMTTMLLSTVANANQVYCSEDRYYNLTILPKQKNVVLLKDTTIFTKIPSKDIESCAKEQTVPYTALISGKSENGLGTLPVDQETANISNTDQIADIFTCVCKLNRNLLNGCSTIKEPNSTNIKVRIFVCLNGLVIDSSYLR